MSSSASLCESKSWPGPQTDVDVWHFHYGDDEFGHKVTLRHSLALNKYVLIVDGNVIKTGSIPVLQRHFKVTFPISSTSVDSTTAILDCQGNKGVTITFTRSLRIEDMEIPSLRTLVTRNVSSEPSMPNIGRFPPSRVGITDYHSFMEGEEKKATVYQLFVESSAGGKLVILERRFSEFVHLDSTLRLLGYPNQFFVENQLQLPPKVFNPLVNQFSADFLTARMAALNVYLHKVLESIDSLMHIQEIYTFFGLSPLTGHPLDSYEPGGGLNTLTPSKLPHGENPANTKVKL